MIFPRKAAFKGQDGSYLAPAQIEGLPFVTFDQTHSIFEHEIFSNPDGSIRIRFTATGKFWRTLPNGYVVADSDTATDYQTLFWPFPVSNNNVVALGSGTNNVICKRFIMGDRVTNCLRSASTTIEPKCHLVVEQIP